VEPYLVGVGFNPPGPPGALLRPPGRSLGTARGHDPLGGPAAVVPDHLDVVADKCAAAGTVGDVAGPAPADGPGRVNERGGVVRADRGAEEHLDLGHGRVADRRRRRGGGSGGERHVMEHAAIVSGRDESRMSSP
jgi:hypothetical protein